LAKLVLTASEFADMMMFALFEKLQKPDTFVPPELNEPFYALAEVLKRRGVRSTLLQYYLKSDPIMRTRYRMIHKVFFPTKTKGAVVSYFEVRSQAMPVPKEGMVTRIVGLVKRFVGLGKRK
jgi:hypothetical protein